MKRLIWILPLLALAGCSKNEAVPFMGQWDGGFTVEKVTQGPDTETDRKHHNLNGYLNVVLNKNKYLMRLTGEQQTVEIAGKWLLRGSQIVLDPTDVKVTSDGGKEGINPNLKALPEEELHQGYMQKVTLKLSPDGSTLSGLATTISYLKGTHSFRKE